MLRVGMKSAKLKKQHAMQVIAGLYLPQHSLIWNQSHFQREYVCYLKVCSPISIANEPRMAKASKRGEHLKVFQRYSGHPKVSCWEEWVCLFLNFRHIFRLLPGAKYTRIYSKICIALKNCWWIYIEISYIQLKTENFETICLIAPKN